MKRRLLWYSVGATLWIVLLILAVFSGLAHGATTPRYGSSSAGPTYTDNPNQYLMGLVSDISVHENDGKVYTTVRIRPTNTYFLYFDEPTFCGNQYRIVTETKGVLVFTYSRVQHHRWCYDLYRVDKIESAGE